MVPALAAVRAPPALRLVGRERVLTTTKRALYERDMGKPFLRAQHYHDQALKMRALAAREKDEILRNVLIDIAKSYDRLSVKFLKMGQEANKRDL